MSRFIVFLIAILAVSVSGSVAHSDPTPAGIVGDWYGALDAGGATLHLVFHFTAIADGGLTATFDSIDQGANGIPFSSAVLTGNSLRLEAPKIGGTFLGVVDASGTKITGIGVRNTLPLTILKGKAAAAPAPAESALPPITYTVREVAFPGGAAGVTIAGTFTSPKGAGPFPAVVLIAGSGPNDRDETILGHKPFALLADTLTRRGVAVLRYDKRGIAKSTGSYTAATTADFANDAEAAVGFLKAQPEIDAKRIGLMGHSEGGLVAPMVASRNTSIAFVVPLAGPGMTGERILLAQSALIARAGGDTEAHITQSGVLQKQIFAIARQEPDPKVAQGKAEAIILAALNALTPEEKKAAGDLSALAKSQSQMAGSPWLRYFLTYDPLPALRKTTCPVLALGGSLDLQVPPKEDLSAIESALKEGGNKNVTVTELPGLNHLFQTCKTGSPGEYATIKETIAPIALTTIGDWIVAQTHATP